MDIPTIRSVAAPVCDRSRPARHHTFEKPLTDVKFEIRWKNTGP
jgi:hypothetical protein